MYLEADLDAEELLDAMVEVLESELPREVDSPELRQKLFSMAGLLRNIRPSEIAPILVESVRQHRVFLEEILEDCPDEWSESARDRFPRDPAVVREQAPARDHDEWVRLQHDLRRALSRLFVELHERRRENPELAESLLKRCHDFCLKRSREASERIGTIRWDEIL